MPCLKIFTSLSRDRIPENFVHKIVPMLSKTLGKPHEKFIILVSPGCNMSFGGQSKSGAVASLESIGSLGLEQNKIITKQVTEYVQKELGIAPDDFMMSFYDLRGQDIGRNGVTLA